MANEQICLQLQHHGQHHAFIIKQCRWAANFEEQQSGPQGLICTKQGGSTRKLTFIQYPPLWCWFCWGGEGGNHQHSQQPLWAMKVPQIGLLVNLMTYKIENLPDYSAFWGLLTSHLPSATLHCQTYWTPVCPHKKALCLPLFSLCWWQFDFVRVSKSQLVFCCSHKCLLYADLPLIVNQSCRVTSSWLISTHASIANLIRCRWMCLLTNTLDSLGHWPFSEATDINLNLNLEDCETQIWNITVGLKFQLSFIMSVLHHGSVGDVIIVLETIRSPKIENGRCKLRIHRITKALTV